MPATDDPVLTRFRAALDAAYGDRIERVVLFGSWARGDARPDSDYDVAVFLKNYQSFGQEIEPLAAIETDILFDTGMFISALPMPECAYNARTGLMHELRHDGIDLRSTVVTTAPHEPLRDKADHRQERGPGSRGSPMTSEAEAYLATAREDLREARLIAALPLTKAAARAAYYAAFHAAEAFIFDRTGKVVKTHSGVRSEFSRLLIGAAAGDAVLGRILNTGYGYKDLADYGTGQDRVVTDEDVATMIDDATRFVARVAELLGGRIRPIHAEAPARQSLLHHVPRLPRRRHKSPAVARHPPRRDPRRAYRPCPCPRFEAPSASSRSSSRCSCSRAAPATSPCTRTSAPSIPTPSR